MPQLAQIHLYLYRARQQEWVQVRWGLHCSRLDAAPARLPGWSAGLPSHLSTCAR